MGLLISVKGSRIEKKRVDEEAAVRKSSRGQTWDRGSQGKTRWQIPGYMAEK